MFSPERESAYVGDEDPCEAGWSEEVPQQMEHWVSGAVIYCRYILRGGKKIKQNHRMSTEFYRTPLPQEQPLQKQPAQNFNTRRNFSRNRPGPRVRRKANNSKERHSRHFRKHPQPEKCSKALRLALFFQVSNIPRVF